MSTTEPTYEAWKKSLANAEQSARSAPLPAEELSLELKALGTLLLVGVGLLLACGVFFALNLNYVVNGEVTRGVVVDIRTHATRRGTMFAPVVGYLVNGEEYRVPSRTSSSVCPYEIDEEVPVLYLPNNPADSMIADFMQLYLFPTILGSLGVICLGAAGCLTVYVVHKAGWRLLPRLT
jgi:Protein of unknown function (DUF3592)